MAIPTVVNTDTFDVWRQKTNIISTTLGDAATLTTVATDAVAAINEISDNIGDVGDLDVEASDMVDAVNATYNYVYAITLALG